MRRGRLSLAWWCLALRCFLYINDLGFGFREFGYGGVHCSWVRDVNGDDGFGRAEGLLSGSWVLCSILSWV